MRNGWISHASVHNLGGLPIDQIWRSGAGTAFEPVVLVAPCHAKIDTGSTCRGSSHPGSIARLRDWNLSIPWPSSNLRWHRKKHTLLLQESHQREEAMSKKQSAKVAFRHLFSTETPPLHFPEQLQAMGSLPRLASWFGLQLSGRVQKEIRLTSWLLGRGDLLTSEGSVLGELGEPYLALVRWVPQYLFQGGFKRRFGSLFWAGDISWAHGRPF